MSSCWIGVDLDGTLARYDDSQGWGIGEPVQPMLARVKAWVADGSTVKIFTARASVPEQVVLVQDWLEKQGLPRLEVTNVKDLAMGELWDDRAVEVLANTGLTVTEVAFHVVATDPEYPDEPEPGSDLLQMVASHPLESLRAVVRETKRSIAARLQKALNAKEAA